MVTVLMYHFSRMSLNVYFTRKKSKITAYKTFLTSIEREAVLKSREIVGLWYEIQRILVNSYYNYEDIWHKTIIIMLHFRGKKSTIDMLILLVTLLFWKFIFDGSKLFCYWS